MNARKLIVCITVCLTLGAALVLGPRVAQAASKDDVVIAPKPTVKVAPKPDAGLSEKHPLLDDRERLLLILDGVQEIIRKNGADIRFTVFWGTKDTNQVAIVMNEATRADGGTVPVWATFFFQRDGEWEMAPESFERQ